MPDSNASDRVVYRTCPLFEATCGLELTVRDERVVRVRGDRDDVFSAGYLCPKGVALGELHDDADRLRQPLIKTATGFREASWDEAFKAIAKVKPGASVAALAGDLLDLEPLLRDAVVLELPFQPLCMEDCPGLCVECGARLADEPDHAHQAVVDPRWAALATLQQDVDVTGKTEEK